MQKGDGYNRACTQTCSQEISQDVIGWFTEHKMNKKSSNISNRGHPLNTALILMPLMQLTARITIRMLQFMQRRPCSHLVSSSILSDLITCTLSTGGKAPQMHWGCIERRSLKTHSGVGWGTHMWPRLFSSGISNLSCAMLKDRLLSWLLLCKRTYVLIHTSVESH